MQSLTKNEVALCSIVLVPYGLQFLLVFSHSVVSDLTNITWSGLPISTCFVEFFLCSCLYHLRGYLGTLFSVCLFFKASSVFPNYHSPYITWSKYFFAASLLLLLISSIVLHHLVLKNLFFLRASVFSAIFSSMTIQRHQFYFLKSFWWSSFRAHLHFTREWRIAYEYSFLFSDEKTILKIMTCPRLSNELLAWGWIWTKLFHSVIDDVVDVDDEMQ